MTREEKRLLLKDLAPRLEHGVKCHLLSVKKPKKIIGLIPSSELVFVDKATIFGPTNEGYNIELIKPYLRPVSSMTEEEMNKLFEVAKVNPDGTEEDWISINDATGIRFHFMTGRYADEISEICNYLDSIHIDYRGLIQKGLVLEAPEGMYNIKR